MRVWAGLGPLVVALTTGMVSLFCAMGGTRDDAIVNALVAAALLEGARGRMMGTAR